MTCLPDWMLREFANLVAEHRDEEGLITAQRHALSDMLIKRRATLLEYLTCYMPEDVLAVTKLNAEITLLLIERGA